MSSPVSLLLTLLLRIFFLTASPKREVLTCLINLDEIFSMSYNKTTQSEYCGTITEKLKVHNEPDSDQRYVSPFRLSPVVSSTVRRNCEVISSLLGFKLIKLSVLSTLFIPIVQGRLGELQVKSLISRNNQKPGT